MFVGGKADRKSFVPKKEYDVSDKLKDNYYLKKGPRNLYISPDITCAVIERL